MATTKDEPLVLALLGEYPALGACAEVDWQLWRQNPAMPYRFYLLDDAAVLEMGTGCPILCGIPADGEELAGFLAFEGINKIESTGWAPAQWQRQGHIVMRRPAAGSAAPTPGIAGFEDAPPPAEIMAVLESREKFAPQQARDAFYTRLCTRRNHGFAHVVGLRDKTGTLVCTAGLYALREGEGYLGAVETLPGHVGHGYATQLVQALMARHGDKAITLICEEALVGFYSRLGFVNTGCSTCIATKPE